MWPELAVHTFHSQRVVYIDTGIVRSMDLGVFQVQRVCKFSKKQTLAQSEEPKMMTWKWCLRKEKTWVRGAITSRCRLHFCNAVQTVTASPSPRSPLPIRGVPPWMEMYLSLHTTLLCHWLEATQEARGLSLKAEMDPKSINIWKLSANHTPSNWSFFEETMPDKKCGYTSLYLA